MHYWGGSRWGAAVFVSFAYSTDEDKRQQSAALNSNWCFTGFLKGKVLRDQENPRLFEIWDFSGPQGFFCLILRDLAVTLSPLCFTHVLGSPLCSG